MYCALFSTPRGEIVAHSERFIRESPNFAPIMREPPPALPVNKTPTQEEHLKALEVFCWDENSSDVIVLDGGKEGTLWIHCETLSKGRGQIELVQNIKVGADDARRMRDWFSSWLNRQP